MLQRFLDRIHWVHTLTSLIAFVIMWLGNTLLVQPYVSVHPLAYTVVAYLVGLFTNSLRDTPKQIENFNAKKD